MLSLVCKPNLAVSKMAARHVANLCDPVVLRSLFDPCTKHVRTSTSFICKRASHSLSRPRRYARMSQVLEHNVRFTSSVSVAESPSSSEPDYKQAIELLNQLQTNAETIKQSIKKEKSSNANRSLDKTKFFLSLLDISLEDLNQLNVIHVSGTKGKGSTCAFIESILRHNNVKTGFYSSPHLVAVRERIRIDGEPLSEDKFASYFMDVYNKLQAKLGPDDSMPAYFNFLTIMAFHVFLKQNVQAAIVEVGIGGEYDCTNVVPQPVVTGVTSLDLDHCSILGETIQLIAWQKAGIFKHNVAAFTVQHKECGAMDVLRQRAREKNVSLYVAPMWNDYLQAGSVKLGINGDVQKCNASLAVQMSHYWLSKHRPQPSTTTKTKTKTTTTTTTTKETFPTTLDLKPYAQALTQTKWLGRCEIIHTQQATYFIDGAHTPDSIVNCCLWFAEQSKNCSTSGCQSNKRAGIHRILIFNCTGQRNPTTLLSKIAEHVEFDEAIFTPNSIQSVKAIDSDQTNLTVTEQQEKETCLKNLRAWKQLNPEQKVSRVMCISDAIELVDNICTNNNVDAHVLVTGSVHLVGGFIGILNPNDH